MRTQDLLGWLSRFLQTPPVSFVRRSFLKSLLLLVIGCTQSKQQTASDANDNLKRSFTPDSPRFSDWSIAEGAARVIPAEFQAGSPGDYHLTFTLGKAGIAAGGGIRIAFPKTWFTNPWPLWKLVQQEDEEKPHYIAMTCSRPEAKIDFKVEPINFFGKMERFSRVVTTTIRQAPLIEGDVVTMSLRKTTAPYLAGRDEVLIAVDATGEGEFCLLRRQAKYEVLPGDVSELTLVSPSQGVVGNPIRLQITLLDRFYNLARTTPQTVEINGLGEKAIPVPESSSPGRLTYEWIPLCSGFYWPEIRVTFHNESTEPHSNAILTLRAAGNPVRILDTEPARKIYWGDLHCHTRISADGTGQDAFEYARDVSVLDFFAETEHAEDDGWYAKRPASDGITPDEWDDIKQRTASFNSASQFVTLLGYECTMPSPSGHRTVIFRSLEGFPWPAHKVKNVRNLWQAMGRTEAITIPHHTGIVFGRNPTEAPPNPGHQLIPAAAGDAPNSFAVEWSTKNSAREPVVEIYSLHGSSEQFAPDDDLAYEVTRFNISRSKPGPHYARDCWARGFRVGVVASSDNHNAQPGLAHGGLTAVIAPELSREAVFDALSTRRTYATTGVRMYLEFQVGGIDMGERGRRSGIVEGELLLAAHSELQYAEIIRLSLQSGVYQTIIRRNDRRKLLTVAFSDRISDQPVMYYARAQLLKRVRGRVARAWSSPVWIDPGGSNEDSAQGDSLFEASSQK